VIRNRHKITVNVSKGQLYSGEISLCQPRIPTAIKPTTRQ